MATIFLIDDDHSSELLVENLQQRGHQAERVRSVEDALGAIERISKSDLVVLDLVMPRSSELQKPWMGLGLRAWWFTANCGNVALSYQS